MQSISLPIVCTTSIRNVAELVYSRHFAGKKGAPVDVTFHYDVDFPHQPGGTLSTSGGNHFLAGLEELPVRQWPLLALGGALGMVMRVAEGGWEALFRSEKSYFVSSYDYSLCPTTVHEIRLCREPFSFKEDPLYEERTKAEYAAWTSQVDGLKAQYPLHEEFLAHYRKLVEQRDIDKGDLYLRLTRNPKIDPPMTPYQKFELFVASSRHDRSFLEQVADDAITSLSARREF
jgi:hypothetical protein